MPIAVVTGASRGLGAALAAGLVEAGWSVVVDGRDPRTLAVAAEAIRRAGAGDRGDGGEPVVAVPGDVRDPGHRRRLVAAARALGGLDLLVNNAGILGPSPLPALADYDVGALRDVLEVNVVAPLALVQAALPLLRRAPRPRVLNVTSDASVEPYEGWGGYGSSKAALDALTAVLAVENPWLRAWAADPGDLRTRMHQEAFPGEDISDRPEPAAVVPGLLALIAGDAPSGRYRVADLAATGAGDRR